MRVEDVFVKDIVVGERAREDLGDIEGLTDAIKEKGLLQPLILNRHKKLLAGGRRLEACKKAGLEKVPCVIREVSNTLDALEIELIENITRKDMHWAERAKLERKIFDRKCEGDPNWSQRRQAELLEQGKGHVYRSLEVAEALELLPDLEELPTLGEAWKALQRLHEDAATTVLLRKIKEDEQAAEAGISASTDGVSAQAKVMMDRAEAAYHIGDAVEGLKKVHTGTIQFAEVDPPYAVDIKRRKSRGGAKGNVELYNEVAEKDYPDMMAATAAEVYRVLGDNTFCVWWFGMSWYNQIKEILINAGFAVNDIPGIWYKGGAGQTASPDTMLGSTYEPFFVARKGHPKLIKAGRSNVFHFSPVPPSKKVHATERPMDLMAEVLNTFAWPGSLIVVPFMGSGVTIRAALKNKMKGFGWDLSERIRTRFIGQVGLDWDVKEEEKEDE